MSKPEYDVTTLYKKHGIYQEIARSQVFEKLTLGVITFNALWIAYDTDENNASALVMAEPQFQIVEYVLCVYFSLEWLIRFLSFKQKHIGFTDAWFFFDSCLVGMMVFETWIM